MVVNKRLKKKFMITSSSIAYLLLVISPILEIYAFITPSISCADIAITISTIILLSKRGIKYKLLNSYNVLVCYMLIVSLLCITEPIGVIHLAYYCFFMVMISLLDFGNFYISNIITIYRKVALFEAVFIIIQKALAFFFNVSLLGLIPNMLTTYNVSTNDYISGITSARCTGNFSEPAMAARYLTFPLFFEIFDLTDKGKIIDKRLIIFIVAMVCTYSGTAIIGLAIGFLCYLIQQMKRKDSLKIIKIIIACIIILIIVCILRVFFSFDYLWNRRFELTGNRYTGNSTYIRIFRGFQIYNNFDFLHKIFGVGIGNFKHIIENEFYEIATSITESLFDYMNGIQYYLCQGGIVGLILFLRIYKPIVKYKSNYHIWLALTLFMFFITSSIATSSFFILFHLIIVKNKQMENI